MKFTAKTNGPNPQMQVRTREVTNCDGSPYAFGVFPTGAVLIKDKAWISVKEAMYSGNVFRYEVTVDKTGLAAGTHTGTVTITWPGIDTCTGVDDVHTEPIELVLSTAGKKWK